MKKIIGLIFGLILVFTGCKNAADSEGDTALKISNQTRSIKLNSVKWHGTTIGEISSSGVKTTKVFAGSSYIYFDITSGVDQGIFRTNELLVIADKAQKEFVFTDSTLVVAVNGSKNGSKLLLSSYDLRSFWKNKVKGKTVGGYAFGPTGESVTINSYTTYTLNRMYDVNKGIYYYSSVYGHTYIGLIIEPDGTLKVTNPYRSETDYEKYSIDNVKSDFDNNSFTYLGVVTP